MSKTAIRLLAVLAVFVVAACGNSDVDLDSEGAALADRVESEVSEMADQIDVGEVETEVAAAWDDLQAELTSVVASVRSGVDVDTEAIEAQMQQFSQQIENSDVADDLRQAWTELKAQFDAMMAGLG